MSEEPAVKVSLADVYAELQKLKEAVIALTPQAQTLSDHETRLRQLERWKYALPISLVVTIGETIAFFNYHGH